MTLFGVVDLIEHSRRQTSGGGRLVDHDQEVLGVRDNDEFLLLRSYTQQFKFVLYVRGLPDNPATRSALACLLVRAMQENKEPSQGSCIERARCDRSPKEENSPPHRALPPGHLRHSQTPTPFPPALPPRCAPGCCHCCWCSPLPQRLRPVVAAASSSATVAVVAAVTTRPGAGARFARLF